jgi:glycine/D-amino acid oxidase-like deaminating enzyme
MTSEDRPIPGPLSNVNRIDDELAAQRNSYKEHLAWRTVADRLSAPLVRNSGPFGWTSPHDRQWAAVLQLGSAFSSCATERVRDLFSLVGNMTWEEQIAGRVGVSSDQYPRVHALENGVPGVVGLSGRGIAFGTLLGVELTTDTPTAGRRVRPAAFCSSSPCRLRAC